MTKGNTWEYRVRTYEHQDGEKYGVFLTNFDAKGKVVEVPEPISVVNMQDSLEDLIGLLSSLELEALQCKKYPSRILPFA